MIKTYLIKLMLQQSESRVFGFFILICFCGCFLLDVLLPLLLLLLLLWWLLLAVPFLDDLFGAIALLVLTSFSFFCSTFFYQRFSCVAFSSTRNTTNVLLLLSLSLDSQSKHRWNHILKRKKNQLLIHKTFSRQSIRRFLCIFTNILYSSFLVVPLIAFGFGFCQHWTLIIAVLRFSLDCLIPLFTLGFWVNTWKALKKPCALFFFDARCQRCSRTNWEKLMLFLTLWSYSVVQTALL